MIKPKVLIGLPTMGSVHTMLMLRILTWCIEAHQKGNIGIAIYPTMGVSPVDNARNEIVEEFLKSDCSHLLFVDSDTIPPQNALERLLAINQDVVSAITPIVENDENRKNDSNGFYKKWNCVGLDNKHVEPNKGVVPIQGCGSSCVLIKRKVFEKLEFPWYRFLYEDDNGKMQYKDGRKVIVGEDIYFTVKAVKAGFTAYADTNLICGHQKGIIW